MYYLFAGWDFQALGGLSDLVGTFPTIEAARAAARRPMTIADIQINQTAVPDLRPLYNRPYDWYHIATIQNGELVQLHEETWG